MMLRDQTVPLMPGMYLTLGHTTFVTLPPEDERIPIIARSVTTLLAKAAAAYGSPGKAAAHLRPSREHIRLKRHQYHARNCDPDIRYPELIKWKKGIRS